MRAIILDTARGTRRLDATHSIPAALMLVEQNRSALEWILDALHTRQIHDIVYIGGYHIEKVIQRFSGLRFRYFNKQKAGEIEALLSVLEQFNADSKDTLILSNNCLILPGAIEQLYAAQGDNIIGTYQTDIREEFIGAMLIRAQSLQTVQHQARSLYAGNARANVRELVTALHATTVSLNDSAAPLQNKAAVARLVFRGKAKTLQQLARLTQKAVVLDQVTFSVTQWQNDPQGILNQIQTAYPRGKLIIRSNNHLEDSTLESRAGYYHSALNVSAANRADIQQGITSVVQSYQRDGAHLDDEHTVLVQQQVENITSSGVVLTRTLDYGAPYFVVNIERGSGRSDIVTSGAQGNLDHYFIAWDTQDGTWPDDITALIDLARELITLTHNDALEFEFAIDNSGTCYLFQVRPLAVRNNALELPAADMLDFIRAAGDFAQAHMQPQPPLYGETTFFGNMPDWNPAEMLGTSPRPLALSLYQYLIGEHTWSTARAMLGYRDIYPQPLIVAIGGRPYVDVRASLNSFLPADLPQEFAERWINNCLRNLAEHPQRHDKIEFEVACTCLCFDWPDHAARMQAAGLTRENVQTFQDSLRSLTANALTEKALPIVTALKQIELLQTRRESYMSRDNTAPAQLLQIIKWLLDDCRRYGVVPFSVLARYAFMALSFLKSLRRREVFTSEEYDTVLHSIPTVATQLSNDIAQLKQGNLTYETFMTRYGHLRPKSYEICSLNYAASGRDLFANISPASQASPPTTAVTYTLSTAWNIFERHQSSLDTLLVEYKLPLTLKQFFNFITQSIAAREQAKFEFMKNVNMALEHITLFGNSINMSREDMSHLHVDEILRYATNSINAASAPRLKRNSAYRRKKMQLTLAMKLPDLITSTRDINGYQCRDDQPNFVTHKSVQAPGVIMDDTSNTLSLNGKIVLISAADPGYDWIFSQAIAGLVTEYGGVASHMAIRAAEFGIPAAVGCGSTIYQKLKRAHSIELDCANQRVRPVS